MCELREVMLGLLLAFSSPVDQSSIREDGRLFVKEALGVFLSRPVCFPDTQPELPNMLMNNTSSTEQVCFCMESVCVCVEALDVFLP